MSCQRSYWPVIQRTVFSCVLLVTVLLLLHYHVISFSHSVALHYYSNRSNFISVRNVENEAWQLCVSVCVLVYACWYAGREDTVSWGHDDFVRHMTQYIMHFKTVSADRRVSSQAPIISLERKNNLITCLFTSFLYFIWHRLTYLRYPDSLSHLLSLCPSALIPPLFLARTLSPTRACASPASSSVSSSSSTFTSSVGPTSVSIPRHTSLARCSASLSPAFLNNLCSWCILTPEKMLEQPDFLLRRLQGFHCVGRLSSAVLDARASAMFIQVESFQAVIQGLEVKGRWKRGEN